MLTMPVSVGLSPEKLLQERVADLVGRLSPAEPLHLVFPEILTAKAREFRRLFTGGTVMYAVKCNPDKDVIRTLARAGIKTFDAASIEEVRLVRKLVPSACIHFMHTVKSREAIREAYFKHGVRVFVLDTADELHKILKETDLAADLTLFVRIAVPKNAATVIDFSAKFGATRYDAVPLLREAHLVAAQLGVMFHPGSQSGDTAAFARGVALAADIIAEAGVSVDALDVGGGFPAPYPGMVAPPLSAYMATIREAIAAHGLDHLELYCEPGRALVAEAGALVVRVELRKGDMLYINDGVYGGLIETTAAQGGFLYPVSRIPAPGHAVEDSAATQGYRLCGPTCDSFDMMKGPFMLPADMAEGDYIVVGMTGAYSNACRTNFNGFGGHKTLLLT